MIRAFNDNLPYDQFVSWQLAGDLIQDATQEQIIATGFNRNHAQNAEGGIVEEEFRVEYVADRTQTFSTAFLGLTMQCARCHDHKYDPVSQKEFYQLFSFFNQVPESGQITWHFSDMPGPTIPVIDSASRQKIHWLESQIAKQEAKLSDYAQRQPPVPKEAFKAAEAIAVFHLDRASIQQIPNAVSPGQKGRVIDPVTNQLAENPLERISSPLGKGLLLNGDDALDFPGVGRFGRSEPFSIGMWVKVPKAFKSGVIFHSNKGGAIYTFKGYQLSIEGGKWDVRLAHNFPANAIHQVSREAVNPEVWQHVMLTYDGSSKASGVRFFLNGKKVAMEVRRDKLWKEIIFPAQADGRIPIPTNLKVGGRWRSKGFKGGSVDEIKVFARELSEPEIAREAGSKSQLPEQKQANHYRWLAPFDRGIPTRLDSLKALREQLAGLMEQLPEVMVMEDLEASRPSFVLSRGAYDEPAEKVGALTPTAVFPYPESWPANRLGLARWLFDEQNPLTARVTVNRVWQQFFGQGLVKTTEDFGNQGDLPTHPELLDWLAVWFRENAWDLKALQKKIVLSATYRQSSKVDSLLLARDPENQYLARGPKSRLSAEMLRDLVLSASGLLVPKIGGPSVKPYQPPGIWDVNRMGGSYQQDKGDDLYRRSLYTFWKRTIPPPSMNTFDAPSRAYCVVKRQKTTTPLQALVLMNDPQMLEAARMLGEKAVQQASPEAGIRLLFRSLSSRNPTPKEVDIFLRQYQQLLSQYQNEPTKAEQLLEIGEYPRDSALPAHTVAAMSVLASTMINLDATIQKR